VFELAMLTELVAGIEVGVLVLEFGGGVECGAGVGASVLMLEAGVGGGVCVWRLMVDVMGWY
jgi:hypothetical protein